MAFYKDAREALFFRKKAEIFALILSQFFIEESSKTRKVLDKTPEDVTKS